MTKAAPPIPTWRGFALRCLIYAGILALAYWWNPILAVGVSLPLLSDLLHTAADTARRRTGYLPIPRHPSMSDTQGVPFKLKGRPLLIVFGLAWLTVTLVGKTLTDTSWPEAMAQGLVFAGLTAAFGAIFFSALAIALLWISGVVLGIFLSIADLLACFLATAEQRKAWHRDVDSFDHRLADLILGQNASIPLRANLAERAVEEARMQK